MFSFKEIRINIQQISTMYNFNVIIIVVFKSEIEINNISITTDAFYTYNTDVSMCYARNVQFNIINAIFVKYSK